jgi:transcriptional regulator GlxA family with amidase domain
MTALPASTRRIGLLLRPGFSMLALAAWLDTLAAVNELQAEAIYQGAVISLDGAPVRSASGATLVTAPLRLDLDWDALLVIAGPEDTPEPAPWLRSLHSAGTALGGIELGAAWLAGAGLLEGQRACADWALLDGLMAQYPAVAWSTGLWELSPDARLLSCAGGTASLDLACAWLAARHGERLGQELVAALGLARVRPREERQRQAQSERGTRSPKLSEALALMEANLGEPLPTEEVARLVGVSRRQLERLFKQHLDALPSRHYLELRLARAQRLLQQSSQSILQIGLSCGFSSGPHFSNAYKAHFGRTPRDERSARPGAASAWRVAPAAPGDTT